MREFPAVRPLMSIDEACVLVLDHLKSNVPMGSWSITRLDGDQQVVVSVRDDVYGQVPGAHWAWSDAFCSAMVEGAPAIVPDLRAVPAYAALPVNEMGTFRSYIGAPIQRGNGELFGSLCGLDPATRTADLTSHAQLLQLLTAFLGQILQAETLQSDSLEREAELHRRAFHDELTGLPNRAMFLDRLGHALDLRRRDLRPVSVLMVDLDDFKAVNDTHGHACGDDLLVHVAQRLYGAVRPGDTLARLGGDEFAVMLEDGGDGDLVAARVVDLLRQPFTLGDHTMTVSASVGVAHLPAGEGGGVGLDEVLTHADIAMYNAKRAGKGRTATYDPVMTLREVEDLRLREPLRRAVAEGAVGADYQPLVELASGRVVAFTALARWVHGGESVPPEVFLPLSARAGLMPAITDHVVEVACRQLTVWSRQPGFEELRVSVDVPPEVLRDPDFAGRVSGCLARHGLGPSRLVLQITEAALLSEPEATRRIAERLQEVGVELSLGDFGTGHSSLLRLQQIPLQAVRLAPEFARGLDTEPATARFMGALLGLGRDLGLPMIVDGVERQAQADVLAALGCEYVQGSLYAAGAPAGDVR